MCLDRLNYDDRSIMGRDERSNYTRYSCGITGYGRPPTTSQRDMGAPGSNTVRSYNRPICTTPTRVNYLAKHHVSSGRRNFTNDYKETNNAAQRNETENVNQILQKA